MRDEEKNFFKNFSFLYIFIISKIFKVFNGGDHGGVPQKNLGFF